MVRNKIDFNKVIVDLSLACLVICSFLLRTSFGDWFSSTHHIGELVKHEVKYLSSLDKFTEHETQNTSQEVLEELQRLTSNRGKISKIAVADLTKYLSNPINLYKTIQRYSIQWREVGRLLESCKHKKGFAVDFPKLTKKFPDHIDMTGAQRSLLRIQRVYRIPTDDLMKGIIKGNGALESLKGEDAFLIGQLAKKEFYYNQCVAWLDKALEQHRPESNYAVEKVVDVLSFCEAKRGNLRRATELLKQNTKVTTLSSRLALRDRLNKVRTQWLISYLRLYGMDEENNETKVYERHCRGQTIKRKSNNNLKCSFHNGWKNPRLLIQPIKAEELCDSPHVVRFYDVLSERDNEEIKRLAAPLMFRSAVTGHDGAVNENPMERVGKNAWLHNSISPVVDNFMTRVADITGLNVEADDYLQVANYGIGGHFDPHIDETGENKNIMERRIATFLTYFSDVEYGGNTPFVYQEVVAEPIKGSAIFWYDIFTDGSADERTEHAACPVVLGNKWAGNLWITFGHQTFTKQCSLNKTAHEYRIF
ncbi:prolyl 4-hydroxylase subunit alpha-1-like [Ciona intestinalis]